MRIGIKFGYCNIGNLGSDVRMDYTIIGGEVNRTAYLEQIAQPRGILLSYETYAQVRDIVDANEGALITVKGINREIAPYAVKNLSDGDEPCFIKPKRDCTRLFLNIDKLDKRQHRVAAKELKGIIARLEG